MPGIASVASQPLASIAAAGAGALLGMPPCRGTCRRSTAGRRSFPPYISFLQRQAAGSRSNGRVVLAARHLGPRRRSVGALVWLTSGAHAASLCHRVLLGTHRAEASSGRLSVYKLRLHYVYTSQDDKITSDALSRCQCIHVVHITRNTPDPRAGPTGPFSAEKGGQSLRRR